jgi:hypothetical protein
LIDRSWGCCVVAVEGDVDESFGELLDVLALRDSIARVIANGCPVPMWKSKHVIAGAKRSRTSPDSRDFAEISAGRSLTTSGPPA